MKVLLEYGKEHNLITIAGVESILDLPFAIQLEFSSESTLAIDKTKITSMEILINA